MAQPPPPPGPPPGAPSPGFAPYAPPGAVPAAPAGDGTRRLGTVALVLGIIELAYGGFHIIVEAFNSVLIEAERPLFPTRPRGPDMSAMLDQGHELAKAVAPWEIARTVPFLVLAAMLVWIATRLRRGDASALRVARQWALAAFGCIALSLLVQGMITMPATVEFQRKMFEAMPIPPTAKGAAAPDVRGLMSSMTIVGALLGLVFGAAFYSAWPIVLLVWSGRLLRRARTASPG